MGILGASWGFLEQQSEEHTGIEPEQERTNEPEQQQRVSVSSSFRRLSSIMPKCRTSKEGRIVQRESICPYPVLGKQPNRGKAG